MQARLDRSLVLEALESAPGQRHPEVGLLHHSDRGSQYASAGFPASRMIPLALVHQYSSGLRFRRRRRVSRHCAWRHIATLYKPGNLGPNDRDVVMPYFWTVITIVFWAFQYISRACSRCTFGPARGNGPVIIPGKIHNTPSTAVESGSDTLRFDVAERRLLCCLIHAFGERIVMASCQ